MKAGWEWLIEAENIHHPLRIDSPTGPVLGGVSFFSQHQNVFAEILLGKLSFFYSTVKLSVLEETIGISLFQLIISFWKPL